MSTRSSMRGLTLGVALAAPLSLAVGCGGQDGGTHVQVDKEKEKEALKSMENYMKKMQSMPRGKGRPIK